MSEPFEDVSRWPVSRYFREVVAAQPDGRILLAFGKLNIVVGCLLALWLPSYKRHVFQDALSSVLPAVTESRCFGYILDQVDLSSDFDGNPV